MDQPLVQLLGSEGLPSDLRALLGAALSAPLGASSQGPLEDSAFETQALHCSNLFKQWARTFPGAFWGTVFRKVFLLPLLDYFSRDQSTRETWTAFYLSILLLERAVSFFWSHTYPGVDTRTKIMGNQLMVEHPWNFVLEQRAARAFSLLPPCQRTPLSSEFRLITEQETLATQLATCIEATLAQVLQVFWYPASTQAGPP